MPVALILIGAILIVVAFRNTFGDLAKELQADVPGFFVWIVAVAAILGAGYIPGLKTPSRLLLGLVAVVIVLTNYKQILAGFQAFASSGGQPTGTPAPNPSAAGDVVPSPASVAGTSGANSAGGGTAAAQAAPAQAGAGIMGGIVGNLANGLGGAIGGQGGGSIMNLASTAAGSAAGFGGGIAGGGIDPSVYLDAAALFL